MPDEPARLRKVRGGFLAFTEVTDPTEHRAYNAWHQLDHLPEQMPLPGIVHGQRWVASPRCRTVTATAAAPFDAVHYVTLYLLTDPVERTLEEFQALARRLGALGRFHRHRRAHLAGACTVVDAHAAPRVRISPEAVPWRPHRGIHVIVDEVPEPGAPPADDAARIAAALAEPGVAGIWRFAFREGSPGRRVTVCWLDDDPVVVAPRLAGAFPAARDGERRFEGPLEVVEVGRWDWFDGEGSRA